jgi:hypothetical protein
VVIYSNNKNSKDDDKGDQGNMIVIVDIDKQWWNWGLGGTTSKT